MRNVIYLFAAFFVCSCHIQKPSRELSDADIANMFSTYKSNIKTIRDSLQASNIDTILIYEKGHAGGIPGIEIKGYVFWQKNGNAHFYPVSSIYGRSEMKDAFFGMFNYYYDYKHSLENEVLHDRDYFSHYPYFDLTFITNKTSYHTEIPDYYLSTNQYSHIVNCIYRIEYSIHQQCAD